MIKPGSVENAMIVLVVLVVLVFLAYFTLPALRRILFSERSTENFGSSDTTTTVPVSPECRGADMNIYSCIYHNSTKVLNVILENTGSIELRELQATLIYADESVSGAVEFDETLPPGEMHSFTISNVNKEAIGVTVHTHCPSLIKGDMCAFAD